MKRANVLTDFSYLIYILLGSPLYDKKELSVTPNITINPPYKPTKQQKEKP